MNSAPAIDGLQAYVAQHQRLAARLPGGESWRALRAGALDRLLELGWPTARDESWKYVPLRLLEKRVFEAPPPEPVPVDASALAAHTLKLTSVTRLVFVNGILSPALSSPLDPREDITIASLAAAIQRDPEVRKRIRMPGDDADDRLALLNLAFLADGAELLVRAGASPAPLYLQFVSCGEHRASHPRVLIDLEPGARASVVEHFITLGDAETFANSVTDIRAGQECTPRASHRRRAQRAQFRAEQRRRRARG